MRTLITRLLIRVLPTRRAVRLLRRLAERSERPRITPAEQAAFAHAAPLRYRDRHAAWSWGSGPLIVLVHGWNGRAAQMAPLAVKLAEAGWRCVALDITGHGDSPGTRLSWRDFMADIDALSAQLDQEVHAYVGHSAGGLAIVAGRAIGSIRAERFVCICAPSRSLLPVRALRPALRDAFRDSIASEFRTDWAQLAAGRAFAGLGPQLLLLYDAADDVVALTEGRTIHAWCSGARLVETTGYGHVGVLAAPELEQAIASFLA